MTSPLRFYGIEGPVWLPANAPARSLYPPTGDRRAKILLLGASVTDHASGFAAMQAAGWLSRSVPLALGESAFVLLGLETVALLPWDAERGFGVLPQTWSTDDASALAREAGADLCLTTHIASRPEAALITARLLRTAPGDKTEIVADWTGDAAWRRPDKAWPGLWARAASSLTAQLGDSPVAPDPSRYKLPGGAALSSYLHALQQVGGLRCQGSVGAGTGALPGQHAAIRECFALAQAHPESLPARLLLHEGLLRMRDLDKAYTQSLALETQSLNTNAGFADPAVAAILQEQLAAIAMG